MPAASPSTGSKGPLTPFSVSNERLTIRPFSSDDIAVIEEASHDPLIPLITTVPADYTLAEGAAFIERQHSRAASGMGWSMAIVDDSAERAVGQIGLWLANAHHGRAEIGYWVVVSARGRGRASEAVSLVGDWAFANLAVHRLDVYIEPSNTASIRVAERAGYERDALLRQWQLIAGEPRDMLSFARFRSSHVGFAR